MIKDEPPPKENVAHLRSTERTHGRTHTVTFTQQRFFLMGGVSSRIEDEELLLAAPLCTKVGKRRMLDTAMSECKVCKTSFGCCNKKHYCRRCGGIVCELCTTMRHYRERVGRGFRVCEHCNIIPVIHIVPQKVWHLILAYCGNEAHHRTMQVCRKMQISVPLAFPWGDSWECFFTEGHFLSKGANGSVYKSTVRGDPKRTPVAVKVIQKNTIFSLRKWHHIHREIEAMRACKHPHVVELINVYQNPECVFIILQFAQGGDLFDWLMSRKHPSEIEVKPIAVQLLSTLAFMHEACGCVHRDIKPENILLEKRVKGNEVPHIRLADFGFARVFPQLARPIAGRGGMQVGSMSSKRLLAENDISVAATPCGTLGFAAPEIIVAYSTRKEAIRQEEEEFSKDHHNGKKNNREGSPGSPNKIINSPITPVEMMKKMDIFATGVTFCILLTGCEPFPCHSSKAHLEAVQEGVSFHGRQWAHVSNEAKELIRRMLHPNAAKRPTASECLQSRWMMGAAAPAPTSARSGAAPTHSTQLLHSSKDEEELAKSYQQSLRSLRKHDGMMLVADKATGAVVRKQRQEIVEDTLRDEPPVAPPGPKFVVNTSMGTQPPLMSARGTVSPLTSPRVGPDEDGIDGDME